MYKRKNIRNWKVIYGTCTLQFAIELCRKAEFDGVKFDRIGIGRNSRNIIENFDISNYSFSAIDVCANDWCVYVPDDGLEELTEKARNLFKDENMSGLRYAKIDNMTISEMFDIILEKLSKLNDNTKYFLIRRIFEQKLYKDI